MLQKLVVNRNKSNRDIDKVLVDQINKIKSNNLSTSTLPSGGSSSQIYDETYRSILNDTNTNKTSLGNHHISKLRSHYLTSILYEYLNNSLESGLIGSNIIDKCKFQISKIIVPTDLRVLQISWFSFKDEATNIHIEMNLDKLGREIRYLLASNKVIGYVPPIQFVRDDSRVFLDRLDDILLSMSEEMRMKEKEEKEREKEKESKSDLNERKSELKKEKEEEAVVGKVEGDEDIVNNVYGVNHAKLSKQIKEVGRKIDTTPTADTSTPTPIPTDLVLNVANDNQTDLKTTRSSTTLASGGGETASSIEKYEKSLKALKINQYLKRKQLSKSALAVIALNEFEAFKKDEANKLSKSSSSSLNDEENNDLN